MPNKAVGMVAVVAVVLLAVFGLRFVLEKRTEATAAKVYEEIAAEAESRSPGATGSRASEAFQQVAVERTSELIASRETDEARRKAAMETFAGFFYLNVVTRPAYCLRHGEQIPRFVEAFTAVHVEELTILSENGVDLNARFNDPHFTRALDKVAWPTIETDMNSIQQEHRISAAQACQLVNQTAAELAPRVHVSAVQPQVYEALRY